MEPFESLHEKHTLVYKHNKVFIISLGHSQMDGSVTTLTQDSSLPEGSDQGLCFLN